MSTVIRLWNLQQNATGTEIGSKNALDVNIANASPVPVTQGGDVLVTEFHNISSVNINGSAGAFVALGSGSALASDIVQIQVSYTAGQPLEFGIGASAGAAVRKFIINQGEGPTTLSVALSSGERLWVRSLSATGVTGGYITMNLIG